LWWNRAVKGAGGEPHYGSTPHLPSVGPSLNLSSLSNLLSDTVYVKYPRVRATALYYLPGVLYIPATAVLLVRRPFKISDSTSYVVKVKF
jgi:hypothetical protein